MKPWLTLEGRLGRLAFAGLAAPVLLSQHLVAYLVLTQLHPQVAPPWWLWLNPLRAMLFGIASPPPWLLVGSMLLVLVVDGLLVMLAFRRARDAGRGDGWAAFTIVPIVQIVAVIYLALIPSRANAVRPPVEGRATARDMVLSLVISTALSVGAVVLFGLLLGTYGLGLFLASPFVIGLVAGYIGNRKGDLGPGQTFSLMAGGLGLGSFALIGFAFEGAICLIMASPLMLFMGWVGGELGRSYALARRRRSALMSVSILPLLLAVEIVAPPRAGFESVESIEIAAPPAAVWDSVVHMGPIPDAPSVPFRWGLAYPMRGEIHGEGVGAVRRGVFSTGVAYERVTEWEPDRKLSFIVLSDPPTMRELSPYRHVNAPHVQGYFRTLDARFTIVPLADGKTRLTLATRHDLDLEPALYWLPLAQWATHANKVRVLRHFRHQAEAHVAPSADGLDRS